MLRRFASSLIALCVACFARLRRSPSRARRNCAARVIDQQGAVLPGVTIVVRHQESGLFREAVSGADGTFLMSGMTPGVYEVTAELAGFKKYSQRDVRLEVGPHHAGGTQARSRRVDRGGHRRRRGAAGRHDVAGDRRPHQPAGVRGHAVVQPQLRRLPRHAARRRRDDLGDDVRRRLDQRRRPERAQRQLHDGRVEQQRHVQRRQRRRAGARAGGSGAGIPAADQPVRRRIRAHLRRRRQLGLEAGHQPSARRARSCSSRTRRCRRWSTSPRRTGSRKRRPSSSSGAACSAARSSATRRISSAASSASCSIRR